VKTNDDGVLGETAVAYISDNTEKNIEHLELAIKKCLEKKINEKEIVILSSKTKEDFKNGNIRIWVNDNGTLLNDIFEKHDIIWDSGNAYCQYTPSKKEYGMHCVRQGKMRWFGFNSDESYTVEEFIKIYEEESKMEFTKDMLEVGMLVKLKNGNRAVVMQYGGGLYLMINNNECAYLDEYNDDLTYDDDEWRSEDIMEVYSLSNDITSLDFLFITDYRNLLWKREKVKEMTLDEIEKALGHKVKIVNKC
jgi:hypothetical protein